MYFTEWTPELVAALNEPFAVSDHKTKKQGGSEITFVDVHKYKERLNATVGPHGWSCALRLEPIGGKLIATVALTVLGVTKENVGDEVEVPELNERGNEKIIGGPATNSYAQAFKRAASDFGLGAYLYDKEKRDEATRSLGYTARPNGNGQQKPWDKVMPFGKTKGKKLGDLSEAELSSAIKWCKEKDAGKFADLIKDLEATRNRYVGA
jgi:hypothetical protein